MNLRRMTIGLSSAMALAFACSNASLPPGTPPPEYERRPVEPWPPTSVAPATPVEAPPAESEPAPPPPLDEASDAGVSDPPDAAVDAAPSTGAL